MTLKQKVIKDLGKDLQPDSPNNPGIRFSMAPDGKSFVYSTPYYRRGPLDADGLPAAGLVGSNLRRPEPEIADVKPPGSVKNRRPWTLERWAAVLPESR